MWSDRSTQEATRVARYWDQLVTGGFDRPDEDLEAAIDPTLARTIAWLERIDDAQPASAEFARRFESQFLSAIGAAPAQRPASNWTAGRAVPQPDNANSKVSRIEDARAQRRRWLRSIAAGLLLFVALGSIYLLYGHYTGSRNGGDSNVILAPSSSIDVPMDRGNAARSGVMPGPGIEQGLVSKWQFAAGLSRVSAPAVTGDTVFITSGPEVGSRAEDQGTIIAIDAATGTERWRFPTEHVAGTTPAISHGIVYAGDSGGIVYALDAGTGQERWRSDLHSGWTSAPVVVNDTVFVAAAGYRTSLHVAAGQGVVVVGSGLVGQPEDGFQLYAFDRVTGEARWHSGDDRSGQPGLFAFDLDSGALLWNVEMASLDSGPAIGGQYVYAGSTLEDTLFALDLESGDEVWSTAIGEDLSPDSAPAISGGRVFIPTAYGSIVCLDASTGTEQWRASAEHISLSGSAIIVDNEVYVVDTNWGVTAFSAVDGSTLWSQQLVLSGQAVVPPVVVDDTLYIGTSLESDSAYVATLWAFTGPGAANQEAS